MSPRPHSVCWRRLDHPGHDVAWLEPRGAGWRLSGVAVFSYGGLPCALAYAVEVDEAWRTRAGTVEGRVGEHAVAVRVAADGRGRWWHDGTESPAVAGCVDVDYGFSPATNLLPIRRLAPGVGAEVPARAAWLRFPEFALEPLEQTYRRVDARSYVYESAGGAFRADLEVDGHGMVERYGDLWAAEAGPGPGLAPRDV